MIESKNLLSETAVNEFIEAVKIVAKESGSGIKISLRDELMMRMYLLSERIDSKGVKVVITPSRADMDSPRFSATWSRG